MKGSFTIVRMTVPANQWLWGLTDGEGKSLLSKGGYSSPEEAGRFICNLLSTLGVKAEIDIWIERTVRSRFKCKEQ